MSNLTPEQKLGAAVLDVLGALSQKSLDDLRRPADPRQSDHSLIPRCRLTALVAAFEDLYPGVLDEFLRTRT